MIRHTVESLDGKRLSAALHRLSSVLDMHYDIAARERKKSTNPVATTYWYYKKILAQQLRDDLCHDLELKLHPASTPGRQLRSRLEVDDTDEDDETGDGAPGEESSPAPNPPEAGPSSAGPGPETWGQGAGTQPTAAGSNVHLTRRMASQEAGQEDESEDEVDEENESEDEDDEAEQEQRHSPAALLRRAGGLSDPRSPSSASNLTPRSVRILQVRRTRGRGRAVDENGRAIDAAALLEVLTGWQAPTMASSSDDGYVWDTRGAHRCSVRGSDHGEQPR
jgi:hypothetical protein